MILQDLLRNIVLYKGIIRPYVQSWREYLLSAFALQNHQKNVKYTPDYSFEAQQESLERNGITLILQGNDYSSLSNITGTRTISKNETDSTVDLCLHQPSHTIMSATISNNRPVVLVGSLVNDYIAVTGKSFLSADTVIAIIPRPGSIITKALTTGFTFANICSFLFFETREKGGSLGERSLPHGETLLLYSKEGGDQS